MVGIFSLISGSIRPHHSSFLDKKENQVPQRDGDGEKDFHSGLGREGICVVEFDAEFKPIEHPLEPPDEDQPAKCPMPDSSLLNDEGKWKEPFTESLRNRAESLVTNEESTSEQKPPVQAVRKRHHTLTCDPTTPPIKSPHSNIFQVFQPCKEFES